MAFSNLSLNSELICSLENSCRLLLVAKATELLRDISLNGLTNDTHHTANRRGVIAVNNLHHTRSTASIVVRDTHHSARTACVITMDNLHHTGFACHCTHHHAAYLALSIVVSNPHHATIVALVVSNLLHDAASFALSIFFDSVHLTIVTFTVIIICDLAHY